LIDPRAVNNVQSRRVENMISDNAMLSVQQMMIVAKNRTRVLIMLIFARRNGAVMAALAVDTVDDAGVAWI
jgi:hypothetical protein